MRNLLYLHLESISRQKLAWFESSFSNVRALIGRSVWFPNHFAAATSTLMALAYLWHGNDCELDHNPLHDNARNAHLNENLFALLKRHGYRSEVLCFDVYRAQRKTGISIWPEDLEPIWASDDPAAFAAHFEESIARPPFAIYCWNMLSHIEHSGLFAGVANGLTDQLRRAYEGVDRMVGDMLAALERAGRLSDTVIVAFGDHGDDFWTHGYKAGYLHGTEPTTDLTWTPLSIFDARRAPATHDGLASSIDLYRTALGLLGIPAGSLFEPSGIDLFAAGNDVVFSQNYFAAQPDSTAANVVRAFAATNGTYNLVASSRGCELFAYRLDPGNHCNLLHLFEPIVGGGLRLRAQAQESGHYQAALRAPPANAADIVANFESLRAALRAHLDAKRRYLHARPSGQPLQLLDPGCLDRISAYRRDEFYFTPAATAQPVLRPASARFF